MTHHPQATESWIAGLLEHRVALSIAAAASVALAVLLVMTPSNETAKTTHSTPTVETPAVSASADPPRYTIPDIAGTRQAKPPATMQTITPATPAKAIRAQVSPAKPSSVHAHAGPVPRPVASPPASKPFVKAAPHKPATAAALSGSISGHVYFVQVGAYRDRSRAQKQAATLLQKGWNSAVATHSKGLFIVRIGPVSSREAADHLRSQLLHKAKLKGFVVKG